MSDTWKYNSRMSPILNLDALDWDSWNLEHITKHDVTVGEILEALDNVVEGRESYKGRYQVIGATDRGKVLSMIIGSNPEHPTVWYVFSARPASRKERRYFADVARNVNQ
jgi:uncharacterized DUF497 family protein